MLRSLKPKPEAEAMDSKRAYVPVQQPIRRCGARVILNGGHITSFTPKGGCQEDIKDAVLNWSIKGELYISYFIFIATLCF